MQRNPVGSNKWEPLQTYVTTTDLNHSFGDDDQTFLSEVSSCHDVKACVCLWEGNIPELIKINGPSKVSWFLSWLKDKAGDILRHSITMNNPSNKYCLSTQGLIPLHYETLLSSKNCFPNNKRQQLFFESAAVWFISNSAISAHSVYI